MLVCVVVALLYAYWVVVLFVGVVWPAVVVVVVVMCCCCSVICLLGCGFVCRCSMAGRGGRGCCYVLLLLCYMLTGLWFCL